MRVILSNKQNFISKINKFYLSKVKGVIVLGERLRDIYKDYLEDAKIKTLFNFSPDDSFVELDQVAKKWSAEKISVLYLSNLLPGKGYDDLLKSAAALNSKNDSRFEFDFAGGFESEDDENNFLKQIECLDNVRYHGVVSGDKKKSLLSRSHIFCLPTYYPYEGQPISILEAYASGMVVITTNHSGIFDIFTPEINGFEVFKKDYVSIIEALKRSFNEKDLCKTIAFRNYAIATNDFTKETHLKSMYNIIGIEKD